MIQKNLASVTPRKILVVGSLAYDRMLNFKGKFSNHIVPEKIQFLSVSFFLHGLEEKFGGTGGNIAYTLSLLGEEPYLISSVGKDFGAYEAWCEKNGISLRGVRLNNRAVTASAYIMTDAVENQIAGFYPGAMQNTAWPSETVWRRLRKEIGLAIISPGNQGDMMRAVHACGRDKVRYIFDPGQQVPVFGKSNLREAIHGASILIGNNYEMHLIMKKTGRNKKALLKNVAALITTLGDRGSEIATQKSTYRIPAIRVKALNPTGAGDAYRAGLIAALRRGYPWEKAGRIASVVASYPVRYHGTQEHTLSWAMVRGEYKKHFRENL